MSDQRSRRDAESLLLAGAAEIVARWGLESDKINGLTAALFRGMVARRAAEAKALRASPSTPAGKTPAEHSQQPQQQAPAPPGFIDTRFCRRCGVYDAGVHTHGTPGRRRASARRMLGSRKR